MCATKASWLLLVNPTLHDSLGTSVGASHGRKQAKSIRTTKENPKIFLEEKFNYMNFSIATLLSHFPDEKPVAPKLLEKKLGCEDDNSRSEERRVGKEC